MFDILTIIIFLALAVFILLQLRSVLARRTRPRATALRGDLAIASSQSAAPPG